MAHRARTDAPAQDQVFRGHATSRRITDFALGERDNSRPRDDHSTMHSAARRSMQVGTFDARPGIPWWDWNETVDAPGPQGRRRREFDWGGPDTSYHPPHFEEGEDTTQEYAIWGPAMRRAEQRRRDRS